VLFNADVAGISFAMTFDERDRMFILKDNWQTFTKSVGHNIGFADSQQEFLGTGTYSYVQIHKQ
jgi:hypothetical protein